MCKLYLKTKGITVGAHIQSIAQIQDTPFDDVEVSAAQLEQLRMHEYPIINPLAQKAMLAAIEEARLDQDSVGGVIECASVGVPAGLGSPMLDSVEGPSGFPAVLGAGGKGRRIRRGIWICRIPWFAC